MPRLAKAGPNLAIVLMIMGLGAAGGSGSYVGAKSHVPTDGFFAKQGFSVSDCLGRRRGIGRATQVPTDGLKTKPGLGPALEGVGAGAAAGTSARASAGTGVCAAIICFMALGSGFIHEATDGIAAKGTFVAAGAAESICFMALGTGFNHVATEGLVLKGATSAAATGAFLIATGAFASHVPTDGFKYVFGVGAGAATGATGFTSAGFGAAVGLGFFTGNLE